MVLESTPLPRQQELEEKSRAHPLEATPPNVHWDAQPCEQRPLISIVTPAYNEAAIIVNHLQQLHQYLQQLTAEYRWELIIVNDGSKDNTGELAEAFARTHRGVVVVHHWRNQGLGQALRTGFAHCHGEYIIPLDLDLSYSPEHIERLLLKIRETGAKVVVTSPYTQGGSVANVPWLRLFLSIWANRFLSFAARRNVSTLTGMVRVYDASFLKTLNLKSAGMEINPEVVHKAMLLGERVEEIPAHLCWQPQKRQKADRQVGQRRQSSMKILHHTWSIFYYGFVFRPVMFFIIPSLMCFLLALYTLAWVLVHCWNNYQQLVQSGASPDPTDAIAAAFQQAPHTFMIGGMLLMLSVQLFSLGILAVQSKRYFEEVFYLGTAIYKSNRRE